MIAARLSGLGLTLAVLVLAPGASAKRSPFPIGSYDSDAYTLTFDTAGSFQYMRGTELMVQGEYTARDSTVTLTDEHGRDACVGADRNPGIYHWQLARGALWFHTVTDPCPDRIRGLADQAWRPHRTH